MTNVKFTQLATSEVKQDVIGDFNFASYNNNIALLGSYTELATLELFSDASSNDVFPYSYASMEIPQERPITKLIPISALPGIYENCSVLECQELTLDPIYVAEAAVEPIKAQVIQISWAPQATNVEQLKLVVLTTYGACQILSKTRCSREWQKKIVNLNTFYISDIFAQYIANIATVSSYQELKMIVDLFWITAVDWDKTATRAHIIYTANAAGYIVAFKWNDETAEFQKYCQFKTTMGRISYIKAYEQFLLVGNNKGVVQLFKVQHEEAATKSTITEMSFLWSKSDRMSCRKAEITYSKKLNCYFVVFVKAAHLLAFRLTSEGSILASATLFLGGIKITGVEQLAEDEFIVTTITGMVRHIRLSADDNESLSFIEQIVDTDVDAENMQILGVAATQHKNLWTLMLYRNKEYTRHSKHSITSAIISVCSLSSIESLTKLANLNISNMNEYIDYKLAICMDIQNNLNLEQYNDYNELTNAKFPKEFNEAFLQKLQIKLLIVKAAVKYQQIKIKNVRQFTAYELEFLLPTIQITHILCRLQYLQGSSLKLNEFQQMSARCMRSYCRLLLSELTEQVTDVNPLKNTIERFTQLATTTLNANSINKECTSSEKCIYCNADIDCVTMMCAGAHKLKRCCISYIQVPLFNHQFCAQCNTLALEDVAQLQQLYPLNETIKCIFCRSLFVSDIRS